MPVKVLLKQSGWTLLWTLNSESQCSVTDLCHSHDGSSSSCTQMSSPAWPGVTAELWVHENTTCGRCSKAVSLLVLVLCDRVTMR